MSATGRGGEYQPLARYYTPDDLAWFLVGLLPIWSKPSRVLEPHVGDGAILRAVVDHERDGVYHRLYALDLDPSAAGIHLANQEGGWGAVGDFLTAQLPAQPDVILGNPPYSIPSPVMVCEPCGGKGRLHREGEARRGWVLSMDGPGFWTRECPACKGKGTRQDSPIGVAHLHAERALELLPEGGHLAFLMRMGILEGRDRLPFWQAHPPRKVFALSRRPVFRGTTSDQTSYGWFWWTKGWSGPTELEVVDNPRG